MALTLGACGSAAQNGEHKQSPAMTSPDTPGQTPSKAAPTQETITPGTPSYREMVQSQTGVTVFKKFEGVSPVLRLAFNQEVDVQCVAKNFANTMTSVHGGDFYLVLDVIDPATGTPDEKYKGDVVASDSFYNSDDASVSLAEGHIFDPAVPYCSTAQMAHLK
jgi:hypothetical protein